MHEKYLEKLENDVEEGMWDLLVLHLHEARGTIEKRLPWNEPSIDRLVSTLDKAIDCLKEITEKKRYFSREHYRYLLLCANELLYYRTDRQDIKDLKQRIVADFTLSEPGDSPQIPLDKQINEVRITHDARDLQYLVGAFIEEEDWLNALYCWIPVSLLEPDWRHLEASYQSINEHLSPELPEFEPSARPEKSVVLVDANILISQIVQSVGEYRIGQPDAHRTQELLQQLRDANNQLILTKSVQQEVEAHMDYIKEFVRQDAPRHGFDPETIRAAFDRRYEELLAHFEIMELEAGEDVRPFYEQYLKTLEKITLEKIQDKTVSKKLRKLAQRNGILPEEADQQLLSEAARLQAERGDVYIASNDKDFGVFSKPIKERYGVGIARRH